ncbi:MAG: D-aminoacyl-tRNA deacylase [Alcanivorax sp.]|nr:D-aminoacyl-tRNA deacylase [Alcanivorax sp.]
MKVLLQRVSQACVHVEGEEVGRIGTGLMVLVGIEHHDDESLVERMAQRLAGYRVFADAQGRMNLDVGQAGGAVLAVSQFTLVADTRKGRRPSFTAAAAPEQGRHLYQYFVTALRATGLPVETGIFAADMQVSLVNDGPVTFLLEM